MWIIKTGNWCSEIHIHQKSIIGTYKAMTKSELPDTHDATDTHIYVNI